MTILDIAALLVGQHYNVVEFTDICLIFYIPCVVSSSFDNVYIDKILNFKRNYSLSGFIIYHLKSNLVRLF